MTAMNKTQLRSCLRSLHEGPQVRREQSERLCSHILNSDEYKSANIIGGYMPLPREADILPVLEDALRCGKMLVLPLCGKAPHMTLRRVHSLDMLRAGAYGIPEPDENADVIPVLAVDLLLVPLEGIDRAGFRLGKGGGYYDCLLADNSQVTTVGCALNWQWTERVPREPWDRPLKACADENGIHYFSENLYGTKGNEQHGCKKEAENPESDQAVHQG